MSNSSSRKGTPNFPNAMFLPRFRSEIKYVTIRVLQTAASNQHSQRVNHIGQREVTCCMTAARVSWHKILFLYWDYWAQIWTSPYLWLTFSKETQNFLLQVLYNHNQKRRKYQRKSHHLVVGHKDMYIYRTFNMVKHLKHPTVMLSVSGFRYFWVLRLENSTDITQLLVKFCPDYIDH